jgi:hypothetical protein
VIVLILVAILWIAVLVPTIVSRLRERRSAGSIGRFHQRLDLLERTGPKLVDPAYRLTGTGQSLPRSDPMIVVSPPPPPVRPTLTLVPPPDDDGEVQDEEHYPFIDEVAMESETTEFSFVEEDVVYPHPGIGRRELAAMNRRRAARRRRRNIFGSLCALTALFGLLGLAPALRISWYLAGACFGLLAAFIGLAFYGQRVEAERDHLARIQQSNQEWENDEDEPSAIVKYLSEEDLFRYHEAMEDAESGGLAAHA